MQDSGLFDQNNDLESLFLPYFKEHSNDDYKKTICCIGAGYVGGTTMSVFSKFCPDIRFLVVDINKKLIDEWNSPTLPIYEPGLNEIVKERINKNLFFTTEIEQSIRDSYIIFLSVNTPTKIIGFGSGKASNLEYIENAVRTIAKVSLAPKIIVEKSTVPVQTCNSIRKILKDNSTLPFAILSNPEFLAEGTAIQDLIYPSRVLIGSIPSEKSALNELIDLYAQWVPRDKIITTNIWSSELAKLVSNAFLAQRVSSINSITPLCEITNANINEIANVVGLDHRIGNKFLQPSVGFGGSCFQKDILNLVYLCEYFNLFECAEYWRQVVEMNNYMRKRFTQKIIHTLFNTITNKKITVLGFAYKKNTGDTRESSAIYITKNLVNEGALVHIFDPKVKKDNILKELSYASLSDQQIEKHVTVKDTVMDAVRDSHAIVIMTEWEEFKEYDYTAIFNVMKKPAFIFDGRNIVNRRELRSIGFTVYSIGTFYR